MKYLLETWGQNIFTGSMNERTAFYLWPRFSSVWAKSDKKFSVQFSISLWRSKSQISAEQCSQSWPDRVSAPPMSTIPPPPRAPRRVDQTPGLHSFHLKFSISIHFKGRIRPKFHPFAQTLRGPGSRRCHWTRLPASVPCPALAVAAALCATLCLLTTFYDCLLLPVTD